MSAVMYGSIEVFIHDMYTVRIDRIGEQCIQWRVKNLYRMPNETEAAEYELDFDRNEWFMFVDLVGRALPPPFSNLTEYGMEYELPLDGGSLLGIRSLPSGWKVEHEQRDMQIRVMSPDNKKELATIEMNFADLYMLIGHSFFLLV